MSKSDAFENDLLKLIFNATPVANLADDAASAPNTSLYVSLHSADPTDSGTQSSNEVAYTSYARVVVARNSSGWTVTGNSVSPTANIDFPMCTGSTATATHFGVGMGSSGATKLLYSGTLTPNISISNGVTPRIASSSTITED